MTPTGGGVEDRRTRGRKKDGKQSRVKEPPRGWAGGKPDEKKHDHQVRGPRNVEGGRGTLTNSIGNLRERKLSGKARKQRRTKTRGGSEYGHVACKMEQNTDQKKKEKGCAIWPEKKPTNLDDGF